MKLTLAVFVCLNVCFAQDGYDVDSGFDMHQTQPRPTIYSIANRDISRFFCSRSNVFIMETCMRELNNCVDGYMARRISISEGAQLMNAIEFCSNSLMSK